MSVAVHRERTELGVEREMCRSQARGLHLCSWSESCKCLGEPRRGPFIRLAVGLSVKSCVWLKQNRSFFPLHIKELWRPRLWQHHKGHWILLSSTLAYDFHSFILRSKVITRAPTKRKLGVRLGANTAHLSQSPIKSFPRRHTRLIHTLLINCVCIQGKLGNVVPWLMHSTLA